MYYDKHPCFESGAKYILYVQFLTCITLCVAEALFSADLIASSLILFLIAVSIVEYLFAVFFIPSKNLGIISSIVFSVTMKLLLPIRITTDINYVPYSYLYQRAIDSISLRGGLFFQDLAAIHPNFPSYPVTLVSLNILGAVVPAPFEILYGFVMPVICSIVVLPLIYSFLQKSFDMNMRQALIGLALFNSVLTAHSEAVFNYSVYGYVLFVVAFWMMNRESNSTHLGIFILITAVVTMTHVVPSFVLLFFLIFFYFLKRFVGQLRNISNVSLILLATVIVFCWMIYFAMSVLVKSFDVFDLLFRSTVFSPGEIQTSKGVVGMDPFTDLPLVVTYAGQGMLVLTGLVGVVKSFLKKRKRARALGFMWLIGVMVIALTGFVPNWGSKTLVYNYDYRFRLVPYMFILIIPSAVVALNQERKRKATSNSTKGLLLFLFMFFLIFSAITYLPSYIYLARAPVVANEEIITPHERYALGVWGKSFMPYTSTVVGSYQGMYLLTLGAIKDIYFGSNPYFHINSPPHTYLVFSSFNLHLPELAWGFGNDTMSQDQYDSINARCDKVFDSGNVWLYLSS